MGAYGVSGSSTRFPWAQYPFPVSQYPFPVSQYRIRVPSARSGSQYRIRVPGARCQIPVRSEAPGALGTVLNDRINGFPGVRVKERRFSPGSGPCRQTKSIPGRGHLAFESGSRARTVQLFPVFDRVSED